MNFRENIDGTYDAKFSAGELPVIVRMVTICEKFLADYKRMTAKDIELALDQAAELLPKDTL